jgi:hypothetical protein
MAVSNKSFAIPLFVPKMLSGPKQIYKIDPLLFRLPIFSHNRVLQIFHCLIAA